jgi:hypothetical protein
LILAICPTAEPTGPVEATLGSAFLGGALALASLLFVGGGYQVCAPYHEMRLHGSCRPAVDPFFAYDANYLIDN